VTTSADETLATWAADLPASELPTAAADRTRWLLLDALASALAGVRAQERPTIARLARELGGSGSTTVIGGAPLAPIGATFLNGFEITGATMCDVHRPTMTHVMPEVVPAALAAAEQVDATGDALVAAVAVGIETTIRVALALDDEAGRARSWHNPGVAGPFGAAAAAGRLFGLDPTRMGVAFGHAGGQSAGTFAALGTAAVKIHQARGAMSGLIAASLAARGLDASVRAFTAQPGGLLHAYADGGHPDALTDGLGEEWHLDSLSLRRWPGSSSVQALIECALAAARTAAGRQIQSATVRLPTRSFELSDGAGWHDQLSALQSPRWVVAATLADAEWGPRQVDPARLDDPSIGSFARDRVAVAADDGSPSSGVSLTILFDDGSSASERRDAPMGSPDRPLSGEDIAAKLRDAAAALGLADRADAIIEAVGGLSRAPSIRPLMRLLADPERDDRT
jgi:2-methylcitrate dehydratase PrpD